MVAGLFCAAAQAQSSPACVTHAAKFEHRWGGLIHDAFQSRTTSRAWMCEDGGRIRYAPNGDFHPGNCEYQRTPDEVRGQLRRIFFENDEHGWAVGDDGIVLETTMHGTNWACSWQELDSSQLNGKATLFDINFTSSTEGFLLGLHQLKKWDAPNGVWVDMPVQRADGSTLSIASPVELYAMDFLTIGNRTIGLAVAEPGYILRYDSSLTPAKWVLVFDASTLNLGCTGSFEPWDVAWIPTSTGPFSSTTALVVGGIEHQCGFVFASADGGRTWAQEQHECLAAPGCAGQTTHQCPTAVGVQHSYFATLYGVMTYSGITGEAVACGYGGQTVRRVQSGGVWIWEDQSDYAPLVPGSVTTPILGADGSGSVASGVSWIVGMFNCVRKSIDGGTCFTNHTLSEPYRVQDVFSLNSLTGWQVGQLGRIAKTVDGGVTWCQQQGGVTGKRLNAITFKRDGIGESGIAVGTTSPTSPGCATGAEFPQIYYTTSALSDNCPSSRPWIATLQANVPCEADNNNLHDITWSQNNEYWTVGEGNLVMHTTDGGVHWTYDAPTDTPTAVWQGVAFTTVDQGVIVGDELPPTGLPRQAVACRYNAGTWTRIPFDTAVPAVRVLMDVAGNGGAVYACGITQNDEGIVLKWQASPAPGKFIREVLPFTLPYVILDGEFDDLAEHTYKNGTHSGTILNDVEIIPSTGEVFIGGDGGHLLHKQNGVWEEIKSETSLHIYGMSFADGTTGLINSLGRASSVVLRYKP